MPTATHNVRLGAEWGAGLERAEGQGTTLAAVIRALVRAYDCGEADDIVGRWLPHDSVSFELAQTAQVPSP